MEKKKCVYVDSTPKLVETIPGYEPWVIVKSYEEFVEYIKLNGIPDYISMEHDLSVEHVVDFVKNQMNGIMAIEYDTFTEKTGYDCALWLCNYIEEEHAKGNLIELKLVGVHSSNPAGSMNILHTINEYKAYKGWESDALICKPQFKTIEVDNTTDVKN